MHTHVLRGGDGGQGGGTRESKGADAPRQGMLPWAVRAAHPRFLGGQGPYLGFVLTRGNALPKAMVPPGVFSPLGVTGNSTEPSDPLQTQFALEINVGFFFSSSSS